MRRLFTPTDGIGLSFVRNPIGASDLSRPGNVSLDDTCCNLNDFGANGYDTNVRLLTAAGQAAQPGAAGQGRAVERAGLDEGQRPDGPDGLAAGPSTTRCTPSTSSGTSSRYQAAGVPVDYVSVQNEPNCCQAGNPTAMNYPGMSWNASGLVEFTKNHVYPGVPRRRHHHQGARPRLELRRLRQHRLGASSPTPAIRNDPLFGGIAWHGYFGDPAVGTQVHNQYPSVRQFSTEHSGGTWIGNQHNEDMADIVNYARNWSGSLVKWSLALNQNMGPHNGGCGTCTGLVTVQEGGARAGQVDYTIEYYTTGHLTKFVRPGAQRIDSTANGTVQNVAWRNPDGSKALIAHNGGTGAQSVRVNWGGQSFTYTLPGADHRHVHLVRHARPAAVAAAAGPARSSGSAGKCLDVAGANSANGTAVQLWTCNGTTAQQWTLGTRRHHPGARQVPRRRGTTGRPTAPGCSSGTATARREPAVDGDGQPRPDQRQRRQVPRRGRQQRRPTARPLQIWTCTGGANQKWTVP